MSRVTNEKYINDADNELLAAINSYELACKMAGGYMPALATRLRIIADEMADRYPDETNGGRRRESN